MCGCDLNTFYCGKTMDCFCGAGNRLLFKYDEAADPAKKKAPCVSDIGQTGRGRNTQREGSQICIS